MQPPLRGSLSLPFSLNRVLLGTPLPEEVAALHPPWTIQPGILRPWIISLGPENKSGPSERLLCVSAALSQPVERGAVAREASLGSVQAPLPLTVDPRARLEQVLWVEGSCWSCTFCGLPTPAPEAL